MAITFPYFQLRAKLQQLNLKDFKGLKDEELTGTKQGLMLLSNPFFASFFFDDALWPNADRLLENIHTNILHSNIRDSLLFFSGICFSRHEFSRQAINFIERNLNSFPVDNWDSTLKDSLVFLFRNHASFVNNQDATRILEKLNIPRVHGDRRLPFSSEFHKAQQQLRDGVIAAKVFEEQWDILNAWARTPECKQLVNDLVLKLDHQQIGLLIVLTYQKLRAMSVEWNDDSLSLIHDIFESLRKPGLSIDWQLVARYMDHPKVEATTESDIILLLGIYSRFSGVLMPAAVLVKSLWENVSLQLAIIFSCATSPNAFDLSPQDLRVVPTENDMQNIRIWDFIDYYRRMRDFCKIIPNSELLNRLLFEDYVVDFLLRIVRWKDITDGDCDILAFIYSLFQNGQFKGRALPLDVIYILINIALRRNNVAELQQLDNVVHNGDITSLFKNLDYSNALDELFTMFVLHFMKEKNEPKFPNFHAEMVKRDQLKRFEAYVMKNKGRPEFNPVVTLLERVATPAAMSETEEVEHRANQLYQTLFRGQMPINDFVSLLADLKNSSDKMKQEVFRCMIHNLFDEYRFFHKYPPGELKITAVLFGRLIQHQLVASITLGIALRYVLESLRKEPSLGEGNENMFTFGKYAIEQFKSRLCEWPQYCSHLIQISHLPRAANDIYVEAQRSLNNPQQAGQSTAPNMSTIPGFDHYAQNSYPNANFIPTGNAGVGMLQQQFSGMMMDKPVPKAIGHEGGFSMDQSRVTYAGTMTHPQSAFSAVKPTVPQSVDGSSGDSKVKEIDRMLAVNDAPIVAQPDESVCEAILFIVNNLAKSNVEMKVPDLRTLLKPEYLVWFATYLVEKRVSNQVNLHGTYLTMLELLDSAELNRYVLDSTFHNVTNYLASPSIVTVSNERTILRCYGSWLGQLTLARNKPLLQKRINLKALLLWGYETGRLIAVCAFVAKVLEGVKDSKVFRPPNPWLMAILGVMRELTELEDLKINIKFEIQVLCKNINVKLEDIPRTNLLSKCTPPKRDANNADFSVKGMGPGSASATPNTSHIHASPITIPLASGVSMPPPIGGMDMKDLPVGASPQMMAAAIGGDSQILNMVVINPQLNFLNNNPNHRRLVAVAIEKGIREIAQGAVERSVSMAVTSTSQLVMKDFANDTNDANARIAAQAMASCFASSLSTVNSRESLRMSICNHLRAVLSAIVADQNTQEQAIQMLSSANLDLGVQIIEKTSVDRAIRAVDEAIVNQFNNRVRTGRTDTIPPAVLAKLPTDMQELLRSTQNGVSPAQLSLYESFIRNKTPMMHPGVAEKAEMINMAQALEAYKVSFANIDKALGRLLAQASIREILPARLVEGRELSPFFRDLAYITQHVIPQVRSEAAMTFCEQVFSCIMETLLSARDHYRLEVYLWIIETVCNNCIQLNKTLKPDILSWLDKHGGYGGDDVSSKDYFPLFFLMVRFRMVSFVELDRFFCMHIGSADSGYVNQLMFWVEIALYVIKRCVMEKLCPASDFSLTTDVVMKARVNPAMKKQITAWIAEIRSPIEDDSTKEKAVLHLLDQWFQRAPVMTDALFNQYLQLMHHLGVLTSEEATNRFFQMATQLCADHLSQRFPKPDGEVDYTTIDYLARLFVSFVCKVTDRESGDMHNQISLLIRILTAICACIRETHEAKLKAGLIFDQRPYHRLLSSLNKELIPQSGYDNASPATLAFLAAFARAYVNLHPTAVPGFAFSWLQLISGRQFLPFMLRDKTKGWPYMQRLILQLLVSLQPHLQSKGDLPEHIKLLYKGALRVMLVLLHDFPEFLCEFHLSFCEFIPSHCIQLRNIVLSAFPKKLCLPDPLSNDFAWFTNTPEANIPPVLLIDLANIVQNFGIRAPLDNYIKCHQPASLPMELAQRVQDHLNPLSFITALIVYIGDTTCSQVMNKTAVANLPAMEIFKQLTGASQDPEMRYLILSTMANQLRYPNSHTTFFCSVLLTLFAQAPNEYIQEQITRVLLERMVMQRPHPWGVLVSMIELVNNPKYGFWNKSFSHLPEIANFLESVNKNKTQST